MGSLWVFTKDPDSDTQGSVFYSARTLEMSQSDFEALGDNRYRSRHSGDWQLVILEEYSE